MIYAIVFQYAYWPGLPIVLYGASSLVAAIVTLLVPDTTEISLPDTVQQAEAIDRAEAKTSQENRSNNHLRRNCANE